MGHHVLACALFCNPDGTLNGFGTVLAWGIGILFALAALIGIIVRISGNQGRRKRGLPPEPWTDMSPAARSLLSGRNIQAYTAKVSAVTPAGITVRQARCCARGHQSPAQAFAHAEAIKRRIETTGR